MRMRMWLHVLVPGVVILSAHRAGGQSTPPIRQIGKLERVSTDSALASIASAIALPGGRVLINDRVGRRVLLLDSTLAHETIVADTTAATGTAYGRRPESLIHFRGDSALLIDQSSLSMFVIGPSGSIARVMAIPRAEDAQALVEQAAMDSSGRLVYFNSLGALPGVLMLGVGDLVCKERQPSPVACLNRHTESAPLVRVNLATRLLDTIAILATPKVVRELTADANGGLASIETTYDPLPVIDAWTAVSDGSVAVLRARDFHLDWLDASGTWTSSSKMPFDWQRVDEARKVALIDSTDARWQAQIDRIMKGGARGASGLAPLIVKRADPASLPDYLPPINNRPGALVGDADGNVWIRTTTIVDGRPVYDVVNRSGAITDRVQLPAFRTIAGFAPGVVYMAVQDATGRVHLERARIH